VPWRPLFAALCFTRRVSFDTRHSTLQFRILRRKKNENNKKKKIKRFPAFMEIIFREPFDDQQRK